MIANQHKALVLQMFSTYTSIHEHVKAMLLLSSRNLIETKYRWLLEFDDGIITVADISAYQSSLSQINLGI